MFGFIIFNLLVKKTKNIQCFLDCFFSVGMETNPEEAFKSSLNNETSHKSVCSLSICDTACLGIRVWKRPRGEQLESISLLVPDEQLN